MALTFEVELGTSSQTSNSYASVQEASDFMESHLSGGAFSTKTTRQKETLLIMAARLIDAEITFKGWKTDSMQAMQFPRTGIEMDRAGYTPSSYDAGTGILTSSLSELNNWYPSNQIPNQLKTAQLELAVLLMNGGDRSADQDADGIASVSLGKGAVAVTFDSSTAKTMLGRMAPSLLAEFALSTGGKRGMVAVHRM